MAQASTLSSRLSDRPMLHHVRQSVGCRLDDLMSGPKTVAHVVLVLALLWLPIVGCSETRMQPRSAPEGKSTSTNAPRAVAAQQKVIPTLANALNQPCRVPQMLELWRQRSENSARDLPIGPGDVIDVSVPEIEELDKQKVRVSADGQIELPLVSTVNAVGLSETELHDALVEKLKTYMKHPRVELFVENYRSRGVAVMGAVQKPGYYDLADENESLQSMIGMAGGFSSGSALKVIFSPARTREMASNDLRSSAVSSAKLTAAGAGGEQTTDASTSPRIPENAIGLDIDSAGDAGCLGLPARPGDALIVPVAGQVMVEGWVQNPGAFAITPGMTLLGAVSAAGGPVFSWWAELIRTDANGGKIITRYTLSRLESGQEPDPMVDSGDVVLVEKTLIGAIPYGLYSLFGHFGTGLALPVY